MLFDPREGFGEGRRSRRSLGLLDRRRRQWSPLDLALVVGGVLVAFLLLHGLWSATRVRVHVTGLPATHAVTFAAASQLQVAIDVRPASGLPSSKLLLDGKALTKATRTAHGYQWRADGPLTAGTHHRELTVPRPVLPASHFRWTILVDANAPRIRVPTSIAPHRMDERVRIAGRVDTDARLTANGEPVDIDHGGHFTLAYPRPPAGPITLVARDPAGYVVKREIFVPVKRPTVHGVHMSALSWREPDLRAGVFALIDQHRINTVELDLKDESGEVGYNSKVPLAQQVGAVKRYYDLAQAVRTLHAKGVRVIGRVVVYRDPILADAAWRDGHHDWVVQKPDGSPQGAYGGFTNMGAPAVREYNLAIAAEAANLGVDEILWDYIRRPEGDLGAMVFSGMPSTDDAVQRRVVDFLTRGQELLRAKGVFQGASLFGIAAARPTTIGQNVPDIARHVDFISPMVYPALWVPGEYRVADPPRMPFAIVVRSLEDFQTKARGTAVTFTPWLQDFSLGVTYRDAEVAEQIRAATELGIHDWILWSPRVVYHAGQVAPTR